MVDAPAGLIVVGAGGHARVLAEAAILAGREIAGHVGPVPSEASELGPHIGDDNQIPSLASSGAEFVLGMGFATGHAASRRAALLDMLKPHKLATIIHPTAVISPSAQLSEGVFVAGMAVVGTGSFVGDGSIVNTGAVVDHDCKIGKNTHVATGARVAGNAAIGSNVLVGAGAVLRQDVSIGDRSVIAAGAVVVSDVPSGRTFMGVPARARNLDA